MYVASSYSPILYSLIIQSFTCLRNDRRILCVRFDEFCAPRKSKMLFVNDECLAYKYFAQQRAHTTRVGIDPLTMHLRVHRRATIKRLSSNANGGERRRSNERRRRRDCMRCLDRRPRNSTIRVWGGMAGSGCARKGEARYSPGK